MVEGDGNYILATSGMLPVGLMVCTDRQDTWLLIPMPRTTLTLLERPSYFYLSNLVQQDERAMGPISQAMSAGRRQAFSTIAPALWNILPSELTMTTPPHTHTRPCWSL